MINEHCPGPAELIESLNSEKVDCRLKAIADLKVLISNGELTRPQPETNVNNHIHTTYSFSPYSPAKALWMAYSSGLATAGIMDHDSIAGAGEFVKAGKTLGISTTTGVEIRVNARHNRLAGRRINHPDQKGVAYMALHGIPPRQYDAAEAFLKPIREARNLRNAEMVEKINHLIQSPDLRLSMESDVLPLSRFAEGGSVTERHILFALGRKLIEQKGPGPELLAYLKKEWKIKVSEKSNAKLADSANLYYPYDLLGVLKSQFAAKMYIPADRELVDVEDAVSFASDIGAVSAYAYLGDVTNSVTGDKKTQNFEDDYLDLLFEELMAIGFNAVTYMPSRNTMNQLRRVKEKCRRFQLFQISGEDINSPRQKFICEALKNPEFTNLFDAAYALIGHEIEAESDPDRAMFSKSTIDRMPNLEERVAHYAAIGRKAGS